MATPHPLHLAHTECILDFDRQLVHLTKLAIYSLQEAQRVAKWHGKAVAPDTKGI